MSSSLIRRRLVVMTPVGSKRRCYTFHEQAVNVPRSIVLFASLAGVLALRVLVTSAAGPLPPPHGQRFSSSSGTTLVEVVAFVSDKNGLPLSGLTRDDFVLDEDGVRQDITHFSFVDLPRQAVRTVETPLAPARTDIAGNESGSGRSYVIVLDSQHVDPLRTGSVKQQARKFITTYVEAGDVVAIVTLGGLGHQSFTSDKARLLAVVNTFVGGKSQSATLNALDSQMRAAGDGPAKDAETATKAADARTLFDSIRAICNTFGTVPGRRRSIVLFSEGIELDMTDMMGTTSANGATAQSASSQAATYAADLLMSQRAMFDAARKGNVSLYTIDPRGTSIGEDIMMRASGPPSGLRSNTSSPPPTRDIQKEVQRSQGVLRNFADQTGGFAVVNSTDFDRGFSRIVDANSTYYVLGYSPTNPVTNGRYRKISVRIDRPGASVSARPGYFPVGAETSSAPASPSSLTLRGASPWMQVLLASALPVSGLGIEVMGTPVGLRGQDHMVALVVELRSSDFRFTEEGDVLRNDIEVGFVAVDSAGKVRAGRASTGTLRLPKDARATLSDGLRYVLEVPLPSERYQIRVGAVESGGGTAGSAVLDLDLTSSRDDMSPAGMMLGAYGDTVPTTGDYPIVRALLPAPPTTSRHFTTGQRLAVYVPIPDSPATPRDAVPIILTVRRPDGTVVFTSQAVAARAVTMSGTAVLGSAIDLPLNDLAPGQYVLGAAFNTGNRTTVITPVSFVVSARR